MSTYNPKGEPQQAAFSALIASIKKFVPPNTSESELFEALDFVVKTVRVCLSGGEAELVRGKAILEDYFGTLLRRDFGDIIDHTRKLTDYVVGISNGGAATGNGSGGGAAVSHAFVMGDSDESSSSSSSSDDDDSSDDSSSDSDADGSDNKNAAAKRRRTEKGADGTYAAHELNADDASGDGFPNASAFGVQKVTMKQIKPNFVRDVRLKALFPADSEAERTTKADKILRFLSQETEEDNAVQSQLTIYLQRFANAAAAAAAAGGAGGMMGYDMTEEINAEVDFLITNRWVLVYGTQEANAVAAATIAAAAAAGSSSSTVLQTAEAADKARREVMDRMKAHALRDRTVADIYRDATGINVNENRGAGGGAAGGPSAYRALDVLDLEGLHRQGEKTSFDASQKRVKVPNGTRRGEYETHDEIVLPQTGTYASGKKGKREVVELKIEDAFPKWATRGFDLTKTRALNPVQSRVHPVAFKSDANMLVCAPTGAGKTFVALMTILRVLDNYKADNFGSEFHKDQFKIVYIAPMKALVQEVVTTFSTRLEPFGITVAELSGDSGLSQQQLAETQMIVATPEKWDIVTRKSAELSVANFVRLIIIDEIHLLHNDRGPILESIVARMILQQQRTQNHCRLVGLSATLPNAEDVSRFMKVDATNGFFEFDASDRPVPLQTTYCAVKKIPNKRHAEVLNMVTYTKTMQFDGQSVMVFVHSRKDTEYTALYLMNRAIKENQLGRLGIDTAGNKKIVDEAGTELREVLKDLIPNGFAVHHAGMSAFERRTVEDLFLNRRVKVLVCTSTLAWGVNLPAHAVIIKGTQIYSPQHKGTTYLSSLDVLQMFGRAGRKGFDTFGEACIITTLDDVYYYLSILTQQLPIESQFVNHLVNALNAEVVLGNVLSINDGAAWLLHTYHYIRTQKCPKQYGTEITRADPEMLHFRENLIHSAALALAECRMIEYDENSRTLKPTPLGRIASTYYIHHSSMKVYNSMLKATSQEIDLFHIFSQSSEFSQISVRSDEQEELKKLIELCPVPIKEVGRHGIPNASAKINVLLQCYITGANLKGMALMTEMVYIKDSAQRILKALYDMCVVRDFGNTSRKVHAIYQSVLRHQWPMQCPLRQLMPEIRNAVQTHNANVITNRNDVIELRDNIKYAEARPKNFFYSHYRHYSEKTMIQDVFKHDERQAVSFYRFMRKIPSLNVKVTSFPVSATVLRMDISVKMDVEYDPVVHDAASAEMIISVEDATLSSATIANANKVAAAASQQQQKTILFHEVVDAGRLIRKAAAAGAAAAAAALGEDADNAGGAEEDAALGLDDDDEEDQPSYDTSVLVPVSGDNKPVYYFVHVMLGAWIGSEVTVPVPLVALTMPPTPPAPTPMDAFATRMRQFKEQRRLMRIEQRRLALEANGGDDNVKTGADDDLNTLMADEDFADDEDDAGTISVATVVGEALAGAAEELFPFKTVSVAQAAAAEAILAVTDDDEAFWGGNVYVGMPAGTGKTFLAELVALRLLKENALGLSGGDGGDDSSSFKHMLYLTATPAQAQRRYQEWHAKYAMQLEQSVLLLSGNTVKDAKAIKDALAANSNNKKGNDNNNEAEEEANQKTIIVISCAANASALVQRGVHLLQSFRYLVLDHLHQLGTEVGGLYETVVSRLLSKPFVMNGGQTGARVVGLSYPVVYPQAMAEWLKVKGPRTFSFDNKAMRRLQIRVEGSQVPGARSRAEYQRLAALKELTTQQQYNDGPTVVFTPSAQEALRMARQLIDLRRRLNLSKTGAIAEQSNTNKQAADGTNDSIVNAVRVVGGVAGELSPCEEIIETIQSEALRSMLQKSRVAFLTAGTSADDFARLMRIVTIGELPIVVFVAREDSWRLPAAVFHSGIIIAAEKLPVAAAPASSSSELAPPPQQQSVFDCTAVEMVQMTSRADVRCIVYCRQPRKWYWESMLCNAALMPVTSVLSTPSDYEGSFNSRVTEGSITQPSQGLSVFKSHYFFHILKVNPAYYGLHSSDRAVLNTFLSRMNDSTLEQLKEAGCVLFSEESESVAPTNIGTAAAKFCVSIDTVRTLMAVATAQLEAERAEFAVHHSAAASSSSSAVTTDAIVRALIQLICNLDEVTTLPSAGLSSPTERRLLVRIAQDLPILDAIRTDLTCTNATDKALVLIMMALARTEYSLMDSLPLYKVKGGGGASGGDDATAAATADEEDIVIATQLLKDTEEIITRASHVAMAAVDIVGRQSFDTARAFMDVNACLAIRSLPSAVLKSQQVTQIPEAIAPGVLLGKWAKAAAAAAAQQPLSLLDAVNASSSAEAEGSPNAALLAAVLNKELLMATGNGTADDDLAERKAIVAASLDNVSTYAKLVAAVVKTPSSSPSSSLYTFTPERVNLSAKAGIVMEHDVFQLNVDVAMNDFIAGSANANTNGNNGGLLFWIVCYNANNINKPLLGLQAVRVGANSGNSNNATINTSMRMPLPEEEEGEDANEVLLKVMLVPQSVLITDGSAGCVVADVVVEEGDDDDEAAEE